MRGEGFASTSFPRSVRVTAVPFLYLCDEATALALIAAIRPGEADVVVVPWSEHAVPGSASIAVGRISAAARGPGGPAARGHGGPASRGHGGPASRGHGGPASRGHGGRVLLVHDYGRDDVWLLWPQLRDRHMEWSQRRGPLPRAGFPVRMFYFCLCF